MRPLIVLGAMMFAPVAFSSGDHHMHIYSEDGAAVWLAMCEVIPGGCGEYELPAAGRLTAEDAVRVLDAANLDKGAILSLAYFYGYPALADSEFDDHRYARSENEYVLEQVTRHPDRLVGFFSVNPLANYAVDEARYWATNGGLVGLKLHITNSGVDFHDPEHVARLRAVLTVTDQYAMPVVIHLRTLDDDYGYEHASIFIEQIASKLQSTTWYLAHMAGWGGYDAATDGAIQAFLDAIERGDLDRARVWFDLAAVVSDELAESDLRNLRDKIRLIGIDRLVFASDWDEAQPADYLEQLRDGLKLSDAAWDRLVSNEAPFFQAVKD